MRVKITILMLFMAVLLCGCGESVYLSERAVVKAVFADVENGQNVVSILAFESEPETDISSAQGVPRIYTGIGKTIDEAFKKAESQHNKTLFYAHNRLLLLGKKAGENIKPYIEYFGAGESLPRDMAIFSTSMNSGTFAKWEEAADILVRECEMISKDGSSALFEIKADKSMSGFIPILNADFETKSVSSDSLMLLNDAKPFAVCKDDAASLVLLLFGKSRTLTLNVENYSVKTQSVNIERSIKNKSLDVHLNAKLLYAAENGVILKERELQKALEAVNLYTEDLLKKLNEITFESGRDIFGYSWWYSMCKTAEEKPQSVSMSIKIQA